jgi:GDPmannose 4,6-dehydratase
VCSGVSRTVRELVDTAFAVVDLDPEGHVVVDAELVRPGDPVALVGDPSKARAKLGWEPRTSFEGLIRMMVEHDLQDLSTSARLRSDLAH